MSSAVQVTPVSDDKLPQAVPEDIRDASPTSSSPKVPSPKAKVAPSPVAAPVAAAMDRGDKEKDHNEYKTTPNDLDPGLTKNVIELSETPRQMLSRVLGPDEEVLATFDVKFPGEFIPLWKLVLLCVVTCGLYSFVLFFRWVRRCFYRWRCCVPALVSFSFGKMAITSKGRVICWDETVVQIKPKQRPPPCCIRMLYLPIKMCITCFCRDACAPPVTYSVVNFTRVYRTSDIVQITQYFSSEAACLFCCLDYSTGVEISFNSFNHGSNHLQIASRSLFSDDHYGEEVDAAATTSSLGAYWNWARSTYDKVSEIVDVVEGSFGGTSNLKVLKIISNSGDAVHNGDVDAVLRDLALLSKKVLDCLPVIPDAIVPSDIDAKGIRLTMETGFNIAATANKKIEFTDWFKMVQVVKNDGTVQIPRDWVPLLEDEEIIAVSGQVPKMTCMQWFLSYLSLGVMYFLKYRRRKYTRSALILTTKRLITMDLYERSGSIPATLSNFSVQCRSYVLGKVSSGYIRSLSKSHLEAGIETPAGAICVHFNTHTGDGGGDGGTGRRGMAFALAMQMSVERLKSKVNLDHMLSSKATDKSTDLSLLPLMGGCEKIVDRLQGEKVWEPFFAASGKSLYNQCRAFTTATVGCGGGMLECKEVDNCCSRESLDQNKFCGNTLPCGLFPCLPYVLTCALRPFQTRKDVIITDMSIIRFARTQNFGFCGCLRFCGLMKTGFCTSQDNFLISWESLDSFSGFSVKIDAQGNETFTRRICKSNCIGRLFCPIGHSQVEVGLDFKGKYQFSTVRGGEGGSGSDANKVWLADEELGLNQKMLGGVQFALFEKMGKTSGSSSKDPKKRWTFF